MFEHRTQKVLPRPKFQRRVLKYSLVALGMIGVSWFMGALGYHFLTNPHLSWVDSFYNAAMILGGMGPVAPLDSNTAKAFVFSGITFLDQPLRCFLHLLYTVFYTFST